MPVCWRCGVIVPRSDCHLENLRRGRRARRSVQLTLPRTGGWGGRRAGAGRKPGPGRRNVPHRVRAQQGQAHPLHVTLRSKFVPLRSEFLFPTIAGALRDANLRMAGRFRIVEFSVQYDHIHLIAEARDAASLSHGMRGLAVSIARRVNRLTFRRGKFWADRWHSRALSTPRAVRHALQYVLFNFKKHCPELRQRLDPFSSAPSFFASERLRAEHARHAARGCVLASTRVGRCIVALAETWLLRVGWRRPGSSRALIDDGQHIEPGGVPTRVSAGMAESRTAGEPALVQPELFQAMSSSTKRRSGEYVNRRFVES